MRAGVEVVGAPVGGGEGESPPTGASRGHTGSGSVAGGAQPES